MYVNKFTQIYIYNIIHINICIYIGNRLNHYNMPKHRSRGAPEIDIMEAMPGDQRLYVSSVDVPYFSSSFQVSPAITEQRPYNGVTPDHTRKW